MIVGRARPTVTASQPTGLERGEPLAPARKVRARVSRRGRDISLLNRLNRAESRCMRTRRILALCLLSCVTLAAGLLPGAIALAGPVKDQNVASDTYYRLDVPNGAVSVEMDATVQNAAAKETNKATLFAMPGAENLVVKWEGQELETAITPANISAELPMVVEVALPRMLKQDAQIDLTLSYSVPSQQNGLLWMEPGLVELTFVSQGPGSFVFIDVPASGENFFDPGCVQVAKQPDEVKGAGAVRWVCGEASAAALYQDVKSVQERCAGLDDACRQRANETPWSAVGQSVTDLSKVGHLIAEVQLAEKLVTVSFRYFKRDDAWAQRQFAAATKSLPLLEAAYGFPYQFEGLKIRQSHHIGMVGAAGIAFWSGGDVLITPVGDFSEEVTVHELAHQWSGGNLEASWLNEGLAEYGMRVVAPGMGIAPYDRGWENLGTGQLGQFRSSWDIIETNPDYWYGKAGAFWFAYEAAIGGRENMNRVLGLQDDYKDSWPLDGEWFMDRGEEVSGANLDQLFLTWVYNPDTAAPLLQSRRAAHEAVAPLRARAVELGFAGLPTDLQSSLDQWQFRGVTSQVAEASKLLDEYGGLVAEANAIGLPQIDNVKNAWNTMSVNGVAGVLREQQNALRAIGNSTKVLEHETEDSPSMKQLGEARAKWAEGDLGEATRLGAAAATTSFNEDAAVKMIALAKEKQATFKAGFLGRIGLLWKDPAGDIGRAEAAYEAGDPTKAMELAEGAYKAWDTADRSGLIRLSGLMGIMCVLSGAVWWLLRRLDEPDAPARVDPYAATGGHNLGDPEARRPNWKDWENSNH
jgi:hypothetical protein